MNTFFTGLLNHFSKILILFSFLTISLLFSQNTYAYDESDDKNKFDIIDKVVDHDYVDLHFLGNIHLPKFEPIHIGPVEVDLSITKSLFMMFIVVIAASLLIISSARSTARKKVPKGFGNLLEIVTIFIRDDIVLPNMGKEGLRLLPYFLSLFFFILFCNLIGLVPFMTQPTKNLSVTTALALLTFFITQIEGMRKNGVGGYLKGLVPSGIPGFVLPVMILVEFVGLFTKPFALLMRLFANITAGSIIILSLIGLIFVMEYVGIIISVPFTIFIYFLELFIALLQAYIFTMLSVLFVSMAMHQEH